MKIKTLMSSLCMIYALAWLACNDEKKQDKPAVDKTAPADTIYYAPDTSRIPRDKMGDMIRYGRDLIVNTAYYIGPEGKVGKYLGNKMNCQSCHLDAGTRPFGLNYLSSHARYPQYRAREGKILTLADRVNNCIERPHNGIPLPLDGKEMLAIVSYMKWLSQGIPTGGRVNGDKPWELDYPDRAADPVKGQQVYVQHCQRCHGTEGEGKMKADGSSYEYPPLWGMKSFQPGSSMHRVIKMAQFVKVNMPYGTASWKKPELTDEEALDVAAFVNCDSLHKRPGKNMTYEYPFIEEKPLDFGAGPYNDPFSERQHKYGPFRPMIEYRKKHGLFVGF